MKSMVMFTQIIGENGVIILVGLIVFFYIYFNSVKLFKWIEDQTYGNREYIMQKLELLFIRVDPDRITYGLLACSFGLASFILILFFFLGSWKLGVFLGLIFGFLGWKLPRPFIDMLVEQRIKQYQSQLVDALNLLGNGLGAGLSFNQALGMVIDEMPDPVAQEYKLILDQNKIGVPMEECLDNLVKRIPTPDNEMFVTSVNILKETGGNLIEVFKTITEIIRKRIKLQQKIDSLTAAGRNQAIIICLMPTALLVVYSVSDPKSMANVFKQPLGIALIMIAYALNIVGYFIIKKVITIKA